MSNELYTNREFLPIDYINEMAKTALQETIETPENITLGEN